MESTPAAPRILPTLENTKNILALGTIEMPWREFAAITNHPHQRHTLEHAKKSPVQRVLGQFIEPHRYVAMATMQGKRYKVDGHTRVHFWMNGLTENFPPDMILHVAHYACTDLAALNKLYHTFDSPTAVERMSDKLYGGAQALGMDFKSEVLKGNTFGWPLKSLADILGFKRGRVDEALHIDALLKYFGSELTMLDEVDPKKKKWLGAYTVGALLLFMRHGAEPMAFWRDYMEGRGVKVGGTEDRVEAVTHLFRYIRENNMTHARQYRDIAGRIINCYSRGDKMLLSNNVVRPMSRDTMQEWVDEAVYQKEQKAGPFKWAL